MSLHAQFVAIPISQQRYLATTSRKDPIFHAKSLPVTAKIRQMADPKDAARPLSKPPQSTSPEFSAAKFPIPGRLHVNIRPQSPRGPFPKL
jgi:hypothetical protein